jgi:hypothetical protein
MKSVNADIPTLAHKERRIVDGVTCAIAGASPGMASNLDAFRPKPERTCCLVFKDRAPSRAPSKGSGRNKGLSSGEAHYRAALGGDR